VTEISDSPARPVPDDLVADHLDLVATVARRTYRECQRRIDLEELVAIGNQGLVEAASRYRSDGGASFSTFAFHRVRGAMLDAVRRAAPLPRGVIRALRAGERVRDPWKLNLGSARIGAGEAADPSQRPADELLETEQRRAAVRGAIGALPARERALVVDHYYEETTLQDAGRALGVSKSRASRIHGRAVTRLRRWIDLDAIGEAA
jgi:RNA polymerase sigma factor FliA